jgi:hypothetical protein
MPLLLTRRQTTYWDFLGVDGTSRVHFQNKSEWHNDQAEVPSFAIVEDHPLLIDYLEHWASIYVSRPVANSEEVVKAIAHSITSISMGWRLPDAYLNDGYAHANLEDGTGQLMNGPLPYIEAACRILDDARISYSRLKGHGPKGSRRVLVAGENWLIAESFRVEELSSN